MLSHLIHDVPPLIEDMVVMALLRDRFTVGVKSPQPCRVGIYGPSGKVYRVLVCEPTGEKARLFAALRELGFVAKPSQVGMTAFAAQPASLEFSPGGSVASAARPG